MLSWIKNMSGGDQVVDLGGSNNVDDEEDEEEKEVIQRSKNSAKELLVRANLRAESR